VQHADDPALDQQRHAEERLDAARAQQRVVDVGVRRVGDGDRLPLGGHAPGEPAAHRDHDGPLDLTLDALGGLGHQELAGLVEQQERRGVRAQDVRDALEQLVQQVVEREVGQCGVRDALHRGQDGGALAGLVHVTR
jgi:hypothetical protein